MIMRVEVKSLACLYGSAIEAHVRRMNTDEDKGGPEQEPRLRVQDGSLECRGRIGGSIDRQGHEDTNETPIV
jgi:hypothetical protein